MVELTDQIKVVAEARAEVRRKKEFRNELFNKWENAHSEALADLESIIEALGDEEERLRELTLKAYAETGNKAPAPGVGIREVTILDYDPKVALDWAKTHKLALSLNKRLFESLAKTDPPGFVTISKEAHGTIATDLSEYLK